MDCCLCIEGFPCFHCWRLTRFNTWYFCHSAPSDKIQLEWARCVSHLSYNFLSASNLNLFSSTLNTSYRKSVSFRSASMKFCVWDKNKSAGINEYPPCGNLTIMRNWQKSVYVEYENAMWKSGHLRERRSKFQPKWLSFYKSKKRWLFFAINMHFSARLYEWALKLQHSWTEILLPLKYNWMGDRWRSPQFMYDCAQL